MKSFFASKLATLESLTTNTVGNGPWNENCTAAHKDLLASISGSSNSNGGIGVAIAEYPFKITTPNFETDLSLNFYYRLKNAFLAITVVTADDLSTAVLTAQGVYYLPPAPLNSTIDLGHVDGAAGSGEGFANLNFALESKGVSEGHIYFTWVPASVYNETLGTIDTPVASAEIDETMHPMSLEVRSFAVTDWPGVNYNYRGATQAERDSPCLPPTPVDDCGHMFGFSSNYNPIVTDTATGKWASGQMGDPCALINNGAQTATVCEDWSVVVHIPKMAESSPGTIGASLMDVLDASTSTATAQHSILGYDSDPVTSTTVTAWTGGGIFAPPARINYSSFDFVYTNTVTAVEVDIHRLASATNGSHFELLKVPMGVLRLHPAMNLCINDGDSQASQIVSGGVTTLVYDSICEGHISTSTSTYVYDHHNVRKPSTSLVSVTVAPYVPYIRQATLYYWPSS
ncbi:MAG: hypothetical protein ABR507_08415 [Actinomycetota bacterium]